MKKRSQRTKRRNPVNPAELAQAIRDIAKAAQVKSPKSTKLADKTKRFIKYVQDVVASVRSAPATVPVDHIADEALRQLHDAREDITLLSGAIQQYLIAKNEAALLKRVRGSKRPLAEKSARTYSKASQVLENVQAYTKLR